MKRDDMTLGVMIDMSRNAVMNIDSLKRFLKIIKKMGYNCAMLYTEDTYEVDSEPYFGYMRGKYTKSEMKEIDAFAESLSIQIIPCIQTLAHLNAAIRWNQFPIDCDDILLVDDERTYELIDRMFATLSECFKSRKIHVGMDEAMMLGRGKHLDKFGYEPSYSIMKRHIKKVKEIAQKYGYEIMIWSDMYFRSWNNHEYYITEKVTIPKEVIDSYDPDIIPVYWDYYHTDEKIYDAMLYNHKQLSDRVWFAGGAWTWSGTIPQNKHSLNTMIPAINSCKRNGIKNIIFTMWGDFGGEGSVLSVLPALYYLAEIVKGNTDESLIKSKFKKITGIDYDDYIYLDSPNEIQGIIYDQHNNLVNPSKYMLYSDYFNDFLDYTVKIGVGEKYKEISAKLSKTAKESRNYGYIFKTAAKLCEVLSIKYELGLKTRKAYEIDDKDALCSLAQNDYTKLIRLLKEYGDIYEKQWFLDNKPCGFDVIDLRIGGITRRTESCKRRILDYVHGKIDSIPELEEKILPYPGAKAEEPTYITNPAKFLTANVLL